jgi:hypothetical protein
MNQPARKPGDQAGKLTESLPVDDPSIPVLTERLTLPPLDLNLDFRLPQAPPRVAETPLKADDETLIAPFEAMQALKAPAALQAPEPDPAAAEPVQPVEPPEAEPPLDELLASVEEFTGALTVAPEPGEPAEATDVAPRVPTSLLVSNLDALLATPPSGTPPREPDEFDLTQSDGIRSNRMESNLREMILLELARRLPTEVEAIVRRHLDGAIEDTIRRLTTEVRIALAGSLREIVDRAVKAELDRLNVPRS